MATLCVTSHFSLSSWLAKNKNKTSSLASAINKSPFGQKTHLSFSLRFKHNSRKPLKFSVNKDEQEKEPSSSTSSSVAVVSEKPGDDNDTQETHLSSEEAVLGQEGDTVEKEKQQEMDWKTDEEFKKFMGNPSIEAAIKLEKKRADRKLKELDRETSDNPVVGFFNRVARDSLTREKERLEKAEETFKALELNKVIFQLLVISVIATWTRAACWYVSLMCKAAKGCISLTAFWD